MTDTQTEELDTGTGYGRPAPTHDARLTEVGPGTPMGEAMRRYWHPIAVSDNLTSDLPHRTKVLGEDLIIFRTRSGKPGVVFERCTHRGSSLFYGRVEEDGIRCVYHGWKYGVQGHCLEQAVEPDRGRRRDVARQPWYPVEERYGLVWVYMGPADAKPALPRYEIFENLADGEQLFSGYPVPGQEVTGVEVDFNWLQAYENGQDPTHVPWLHYRHSGLQLGGVGTTGFTEDLLDPDTSYARIDWNIKTDQGIAWRQKWERQDPDGAIREMYWGIECQLPNIVCMPDFVNVVPDIGPDQLIWFVPSDDTSHRIFVITRGTDYARHMVVITGITQNGKPFFQITEEEKQRFPGDFEAQGSQGPITKHSEETLALADRGVVALRRLLRKMVDDVEKGIDPQGTERGAARPRGAAGQASTIGVRRPETSSAAAGS